MEKFGNKPQEAFRDVQKGDSIIKWYDDEGLIRPIRSVRCHTGLSAVVPVKKDEEGRDIGFVKPGNNHHIAIYIDSTGKRLEHACTFWHAVERKKYNLPVVIKNTNDVWDIILSQSEGTYPESFLEKLPPANMTLEMSLQQNEMIILGADKQLVDEMLSNKDYAKLSEYLYVVWSLSNSDYWFRHHLETKNSELKSVESAKEAKRYYRSNSVAFFMALAPLKVKINHIGEIVAIGNQ
ncbi:hypothetical protein M2480_001437 [Parabacteroides sp. PFB2-12]|uniref:hypothetical protein n=1 Tax=unclassified Parabacteroides TaxID=2649774 RepID=UPI002473A47A|nr:MULTISPECIES: hypothetical protein [unclassified Parabacteroides]MDH6342908.1 hypothetical protein [Parabacteroides sp. PM6-13]MDH6390462.1 hypothetical protein [Parabacteroides sp. PFB2-12]